MNCNSCQIDGEIKRNNVFNKTWINSDKAWAVQRQKDVDLEKYWSIELK